MRSWQTSCRQEAWNKMNADEEIIKRWQEEIKRLMEKPKPKNQC